MKIHTMVSTLKKQNNVITGYISLSDVFYLYFWVCNNGTVIITSIVLKT